MKKIKKLPILVIIWLLLLLILPFLFNTDCIQKDVLFWVLAILEVIITFIISFGDTEFRRIEEIFEDF